jgi:hypothetical protein
MAVVTLSVVTTADAAKQLSAKSPAISVARAIAGITKVLSGGKGKIYLATDTSSTLVQASNTITITHANLAANDTLTIGGVVLTAKASGATGAQFNIGADATADAVAIVACIIANVPGVTATSALGVVTPKCLTPGVVGNRITMATSKATAFAFGGATGALLNGAGASGTVTTYQRGVL